MKLVISPAKSLELKKSVPTDQYTQGLFLSDSEILNKALKKKSAKQLSELMSISLALGEINYERNQNWTLPFNPENSRQAIFTFDGDVYKGLDAYSLDQKLLPKLQNTVLIISGLYGLLKPLDLIQPYRLEMKTKFQVGKNDNLYDFWRQKITKALNVELSDDGLLINLASNEYFKAIDTKTLNGKIISPQFKVLKNGTLKTIGIFAKQARGLMTRFILENNIKSIQDLEMFDYQNYRYLPSESTELSPVFVK